jgi:hypothetical protein
LIEEDDVIAGTVLQPCIAGGGDASVALLNAADLSVLGGDIGALVSRAVVHNDDFKIGIALGKDALDRLTEKSCSVIAGNDD